MKIPRRRFLRLGAGAAALPIISQVARAENQPSRPELRVPEQPLAQRLAAYAHRLRYEDLDAATIERVKTHVIDTIGCGLCAWDERPVRICREIALSNNGPATIIGTHRQATADMATFANGAAFRYLDFNVRRPVCCASER